MRFVSLSALAVLMTSIACGGGDDEATALTVTGGSGSAGTSSAGSSGASSGGSSGTSTAGSAGKSAAGASGNAGGNTSAGAGGTGGAGQGGTSTAGAAGTSGGGAAGKSGGGGTAGQPAAGAGGKSTAGAAGSAGKATAGAGGATAGAAGMAGSSGGTAALCAGVASASFDPPNVCDGPGGQTTKEVPANGIFSTSWFGCYLKADGTIYKDPGDNCEFACGPKGHCPATQPGPECEAALKWFSADADRYGCGAKLRVTNCVNGKQVVVVALDRGPNCNSVEKAYGAPVLDMSHDAMVYLFDGKTYGGNDKKRVVVEEVGATEPLGPVN